MSVYCFTGLQFQRFAFLLKKVNAICLSMKN